MTTSHGPGIAWLAARTGRDPDDLLVSPATALVVAVRELARLAAEADSADPREREAAESALAELREQMASAPPPSEKFLKTVAEALRRAAERLKVEGG